jgi:hypothetical protein
MTMRLDAAERTTGWDTHTAWVHLSKDRQQLNSDVAADADRRVIAADKAAVVESRQQVAQNTGRHLLDVTV